VVVVADTDARIGANGVSHDLRHPVVHDGLGGAEDPAARLAARTVVCPESPDGGI